MSTKIEGVFPHGITSYEELESLPARLRPTLPLLAIVQKSYWQSSQSSADPLEPAWRIGPWGPPSAGLTPRQQWEAGQGPMLFAPGKIPADSSSWLVFGRRCLFVTTGVKWWTAMDRPALFPEVRDYFRGLSTALGSRIFMLHRENGGLSWDWVLDGMTIDQIETEFVQAGAKATTDLEVLVTSTFKEKCHYREARESS